MTLEEERNDLAFKLGEEIGRTREWMKKWEVASNRANTEAKELADLKKALGFLLGLGDSPAFEAITEAVAALKGEAEMAAIQLAEERELHRAMEALAAEDMETMDDAWCAGYDIGSALSESLISEAVAAEREACALAAKLDGIHYPGDPPGRIRECTSGCQSRIADAIRARGAK